VGVAPTPVNDVDNVRSPLLAALRSGPTVLDFRPRYVFRSRWEVPALQRDVYEALRNLEAYPTWWRQFRIVNKVGDDSYWMVVHSFLPYRIAYTLTTRKVDRARGVLHATVDGDIVGGVRWVVHPSPKGSVAYFEERVETAMDLLNLLAPAARWAFQWNHDVMMRDGHIGLRGYLAGAGKIKN
jgi:hypothetical protein